MRCPDADQLAAYEARALDTPAALLIEAHLAECASCGAARTLARTLRRHTDELPAALEPTPRAPHFVSRTEPGGAEIELGRGGIGRVLLAGDEQLGRDVAMKVLLTSRLPADEQRAAELRFLREARVTGQLEHPAIVPVYQCGRREDGSLFYVMRRITGRTLAEALEAAGSLAGRLTLMRDVFAVCQAVSYAHSRRVVHRDLKPQNVMLGRFGETYLVDWGLAAVRGAEEETSQVFEPLEGAPLRMTPNLTQGADHLVMGTPAYMSPEQAAGDIANVDEKSDVWGLGAILFEVLTGRPPRISFDQREVPKVLTLEPEAPRELAAICERALAESRDARYPTAAALAADLEAWMNGRRVEAYEYRPIDLLRRFGWQYRAPLLVALAGLAVVVALSLESWRRVRVERDEARELAQLVFVDLGQKLTPGPGVAPVVEAVSTRALAFYERMLDEHALSPEERQPMAAAVVRLLQLNDAMGRADESLRLAALCDRLTEQAEAMGEPLLSSRVYCSLGRATVAMQREDYARAGVELDEAEARLGLGSTAWSSATWLAVRSALLSRRFQVAYARNELPLAVRYAEEEVALDEQRRRGADTEDARLSLSNSYRDLSLARLATGDSEGAVKAGDLAISVLERDGGSLRALEVLASAQTQQAQVLRLLDFETERAGTLEAGAENSYARLLELNPSLIEPRQDFAVLLLRRGKAEEAFQQYQRSAGLGGKSQEAIVALAALLAGRTDFVLQHRDSLASAKEHTGLWVLACALALSHDARAAAEVARLAAKDTGASIEWPQAAVDAWVKGLRGPVAPVLSRFAADYASGIDRDDAAWAAFFDAFAKDLDTLAQR